MKCSKCKNTIEKNSKFCPKCGWKIKKHRFRNCILGLLLIFMFLGILIAVAWKIGWFGQGVSQKELNEVNKKCIVVEIDQIQMQTETEGVAAITIYVPDYENIFEEADKHWNREQYVLEALESGKYEQKNFERTAEVTIENGEKVIHSEEIVNEVIYQELLDAIHLLAEDEND